MLAASRGWRRAGRAIGLVPTMGALHAGHMSLVELARRENDIVVVSVFVNPLQFGPEEDLDRYPRDWEHDAGMLAAAGVDAVYSPTVESMYRPGSTTRVRVGGVSEPLEGAARPGHFEGVATVVAKLFVAVEPDRAYFGQKDAQQVAVITRMADDLDMHALVIRVGPTVRERDGLALSSRNAYLTPDERRAAVSLSAGLKAAADAWSAGERDALTLETVLRAPMAAQPLVAVEYAELVEPATFRKPGPLAVVAAKIGSTRLIDNHDLTKPFPG